MKQTLIDKYLAGETTVKEEDELKRLLQDTPSEQLTSTDKAVLSLLGQDHNTEEEDIFSVNYTDEFDRIMSAKQKQTPRTADESVEDVHTTVELKPKILLWKRVAGIAASIAIIFGSAIIWNTLSEDKDNTLAKVETPRAINTTKPDVHETIRKEEPHEGGITTDEQCDRQQTALSNSDETETNESYREREETIDINDLVAENEDYEDLNVDISLLDISLAQASVQGDDIRSTLYAINNELFQEE